MTKGTASPLKAVPFIRKAIRIPITMPSTYSPIITRAPRPGKKAAAKKP